MKNSNQSEGKKAQISRGFNQTTKSGYLHASTSNKTGTVSKKACKKGFSTRVRTKHSADDKSRVSAISEAISILYESEIKDIQRFVEYSQRVKSLND